ncbi:RdgB/HAM1 family non-canonical purine NTP pyrophosphatase [Nocardiopsis sp. L17-MgMaSL7]|uniref:RdgB/HAM1 family non-canonical purine NTP pyrophosphatase n=1 Tax=Nocardiopsis sp. L17-MgMaSL7 TaxID=1938893 RepID=UPI000D70E10F|nr:RdgB/HAM1 family non-canonical purine NTP pyrophosphatase [Nocardiopsis sp. L17-MgMaSL7]PWV52660.1 XTP/dITP diphosphohydrolase [Nocardiopsis sp. L17-MgMaSL7]
MKLVLATRNAKKVPEMRAILAEAGVSAEVLALDAFPDAPEVPETEPSFIGNALLKARAIAEHTGLPAVADDSGLSVDELRGMPGVLSARWAGRFGADDQDRANLDLVLDQLADTPADRRGAEFVCAAVLVMPDGIEAVAEGVLRGRLVGERRGGNGVGYDPVFVPEGETRTAAELSPEEKNAISHRGIAFRQLARELAEIV